MTSTNLPLDLGMFASYSASELQAAIGIGCVAWRYMVLVPVEEMSSAGEVRQLAQPELLEDLMGMLCVYFAGLSVPGTVKGWGLRDPQVRTSIEINTSMALVVYARPLALADRFFEQFQQQLQKTLGQGVILVERQEVFLLGPNRYSPPESVELLAHSPAN